MLKRKKKDIKISRGVAFSYYIANIINDRVIINNKLYEGGK